MDDVFDTSLTDTHSELEVASRDWERRAAEVHNAGVREGYFARTDALLQEKFDTGIHQGFGLTFELAVLRGRLSVKAYYSVGENKSKIENVIHLISVKEQELISSGYQEKDSASYQELVKEAEILLLT
uniref:Essential protein Yae1 N-terminal domain-containing protein n=1 Tax=Trichobilharzia regenti TaxID=157069 RepID=A0AA85K2D9_TRIRE|nr:unnamed protein product [Trichobilharzia regenti]